MTTWVDAPGSRLPSRFEPINLTLDFDPDAGTAIYVEFQQESENVYIRGTYTAKYAQSLITGRTLAISRKAGWPAPFTLWIQQGSTVVATTTSDVANASTVSGATCTDALETLKAAVAAVSTPNSTGVANASGVSGATVTAALNTLSAALASAGPISSVFGRTGAVAATAGDYNGTKVTNDSSVSGATVKDALNTLAGLVGSASFTISSVSADTSVLEGTYTLVDLAAAGANRTITLDAAFADTKECVIKIKGRALGYTVTVDAGSGRTIDGVSQTVVLSSDGEVLRLRRSGSAFWEG